MQTIVLAAAMSTANALLISMAGCFSRDFYNKVYSRMRSWTIFRAPSSMRGSRWPRLSWWAWGSPFVREAFC